MARPVSESLQEYARGIGGGLLFSLPLFYTMEVWAVGVAASPARLISFVVGTFALLVAYNQLAGIRASHTWGEVVLETIEEMGLGLAVAALLLVLLGRFPPETLSLEALRLLTLEGMVAALGVSVGTAQLGEAPGDEDDDDDAEDEGSGDEKDDADDNGDAEDGETGVDSWSKTGRELALAMCGAVLIGSAAAPTEEVLILGAEASAWALAGIAVLSVVIGGGILYFSAFRGAKTLAPPSFGPIGGTVVMYAIALVASGVMLWGFGFDMSPRDLLGPLVVLSFPTTLGASAGRLLLAQP